MPSPPDGSLHLLPTENVGQAPAAVSLYMRKAVFNEQPFRMTMTARPYCCATMEQQIEYRCSMHPNPFDCPDNVVVYVPQYDEFGLVVRDGEDSRGDSFIEISHCPWCGTKLPESKRDRYYEELDARGIDPADDEVPTEFLSDAWWADPT